MRILLYLKQLATGGAERQFVQLARALAGLGHEVRLTTMQPGGALSFESDAEVQRASLFAEPRRGLAAARQIVAAPSRLAREVERWAPDVVYSALYLNNAVAERARSHREFPLVWGLRNAQQKLGPLRRAAFEYGRWKSAGVSLAISNSEAGRLAHEDAGFRFQRHAVVPNGIDTERFSPDADAGRAFRAALGVKTDAFLVGLVGRISPNKDHGTFLRAAAKFAEQRPDARFVCVGKGKQDLVDRLREQARALGLEPRLVWAGERMDMAAVYGALDLAASTSVVEGFANVVGEALACSVPCVATDAGDSARILSDVGWIVPVGAAERHAEAWGKVADLDREELSARMKRGRERVVRDFSVEACARETARLLGSVHAGVSSTVSRPGLPAR